MLRWYVPMVNCDAALEQKKNVGLLALKNHRGLIWSFAIIEQESINSRSQL